MRHIRPLKRDGPCGQCATDNRTKNRHQPSPFMMKKRKSNAHKRKKGGNRMNPRNVVTLILGIVLTLFGIIAIPGIGHPVAAIALFFGATPLWFGWWRGQPHSIVFGHAFIMVGCFLITWGIYLLPDSNPILAHIFGRPLFCGIFSLMGGVWFNYHGFCRCVRNQK